MSCVGREVVRDAAGIPIIDVVDDHDLVTDSVVLQVSVRFHNYEFLRYMYH